ncbi:ligand-binding protein SH3 [Caballeronia ptereochthonis]|uniref:Small multidrug resistance protein n=1 Tax=Caballeronia ptereochthonis TaxID=1777144 RepID=A0A158BHQ9_9BURK|nr:ligand-binding protein SH3 [Caballeronia ptereochthonis]SAK69628.1 small multidrug resistance protein [Caballeronia ptereochthonis]
MPYITLLLSGSCSALASILLRLAGKLPADSGALLFGLAARPMLYRFGALGAYGAGFLLYAIALKRVELSVAYPLMVAVTILEIMLFGVVLGEGASLRTIAGATLLIVSVLLLYAPNPATA